jgi:hypothetical protein
MTKIYADNDQIEIKLNRTMGENLKSGLIASAVMVPIWNIFIF